ncbi:MAG: ABC transporter ATP-binding protein [Caldilineales bacterium]|nr:ABC transporter ATP-binding protein [Caldilineales bacterium]MDW8316900.1 ABC transporter ATP-binding protein [Anaerolineae bacterium]
MTPVLELRNITKRFPGVLANDHINLTLEEGEIHALLGENGAGKSTLMNILYGLYHPDEGEIYIRGQRTQINGPTDAIRQGIGMVHQHFMLVPVLTVTENVMLGNESVKGLVLDRKAVAARIREISQRHGLEVDPDVRVEDLSVGVRQRVEIIKVLYRNANILILDEPTAVLTPQEADDLFEILRSLRSQGVSIIFISHKLREVLALADRVTVIRRGRVVGETPTKDANQAMLAEMMVGRRVALTVQKPPAKPGEVVLAFKNLKVLDNLMHLAVNGASLEVRAGEIVGVAGVQGNGQTELVEALTGLRPVQDGTITIAGKDVTNASPRVITECGVAHIPEDRQEDGLVLPFPIHDNLVINTFYHPPFANGWVVNHEAIRQQAERLVQEFDVRTPSAAVPVATLSGGNQQKVIVAREMSRPIKLLIANQPTRGLDVGSIEYIHRRILEKRDQGVAVLLVSAELDEIMGLADRIAVMFKGKFTAVVDADEVSKEQVGLMMAGSSLEEALAHAPKPVSKEREIVT